MDCVTAEHGTGEQETDQLGLAVGVGLGEDLLQAPARARPKRRVERRLVDQANRVIELSYSMTIMTR